MSSNTTTLLNRENNARRLTEMRFAVANIGNESIRCPSSVFPTSISPSPSSHTPPSSSPPTSSPPPRPSSSKPGTVQPAAQEGPVCRWERVYFSPETFDFHSQGLEQALPSLGAPLLPRLHLLPLQALLQHLHQLQFQLQLQQLNVNAKCKQQQPNNNNN